MAWNLRPLRDPRPPATCPSEGSPDRPAVLSPSARAQLLAIFRRLAAVLQLTAPTAETAGKLEHHAALGARLAIFRARVVAGEEGPLLAMALADFGQELKCFIAVELGLGHD